MSLSLFIARRIYHESDDGKQVSRPVVLIAMAGIAIGLAVMIIAVAVVIGFKSEVRDKVVGFGSHIQVASPDVINSYETHPIAVGDSMMTALPGYPQVNHVQRYSTKPGTIKTDDAFQGMVLRGVEPEFDPSFTQEYLVEGEIPAFSDSTSSNQVPIPKALATKVRLKLGDKIYTYYIQDNICARRLTIADIYQTNFSEYDNLFLLTDLYLVNCLSGWEPEQVNGVELQVRSYDKLKDITYEIAVDTGSQRDKFGGVYYVRSIEQLNSQIFEWLNLLDLNVWVILFLMIGVADFTVISSLLVIIIKRTNMIGILKALGADNFTIRKTFLWSAVFLIGKGMLWGNATGLAFCFIRSQFGIFKLDPEDYYADMVSVSFSVWFFLLIDVGTSLASVLMLIGPSYLITKINSASSMRHE